MELASAMKIQSIKAHCDSQLVVKQVLGEYGVLNPTLVQYHQSVKRLEKQFPYFKLVSISRTQNNEADQLSRLKEDELSKKFPNVMI